MARDLDRDPHEEENQDADWIFASSDPHTLPTERLPDRAEFDRYAAPLLARRAEPSLPEGGESPAPGDPRGSSDPRGEQRTEAPDRTRTEQAPDAPAPAADEHATVDLSRLDPADLRRGGAGDLRRSPSGERRPRKPWAGAPAPALAGARPGTEDAHAERSRPDAEPDAATGALPVLDEEGEAPAEQAREEKPSYARSGTTPNAEERIDERLGWISLPERFRAIGVFDTLRDVLALICLVSALTTTFTLGELPLLDLISRIAIGVSVAAMLAVHLLRWIPSEPPLRLVRGVRFFGMMPALLTALGVIVADLVLSIPVLFASLPEGPPVGIGVGVSLLLLGALVGIEPRAHEGYLPTTRARERSRQALIGIGVAAAVSLLIALVMIVGRIFTTGWAYSLMTFASAVVSVLLLLIVLASALLRDRSWFVFCTAAVGGLVIAALADNTLRLEFATPISFATGYVYLPFLFAAFGLMISRSFVRTMPMSFQRPDWLVYTVRALEFSVIMHVAAVFWQIMAAIAGGSEVTAGGTVLHLFDAAICASFVVVSLFARRSLLEKPADLARSSGVVAGVVLVVVGFLDIIVNSLGAGAGAGLTTGGVALAIGIAVALMLTVPAPVRDEFGAPDLGQMFTDFRLRAGGRSPLFDRVPDVTEERSRKKAFPGG